MKILLMLEEPFRAAGWKEKPHQGSSKGSILETPKEEDMSFMTGKIQGHPWSCWTKSGLQTRTEHTRLQHVRGGVHALTQIWRKIKRNLRDGIKRSYFKYFSLWFTMVAEHLEKPSKWQSPFRLKQQVTTSITIYSSPNIFCWITAFTVFF